MGLEVKIYDTPAGGIRASQGTFSSFKTFRCLEEAKKLYPERVSLDVIFGRPGQSVDDWDHELNQVNYHMSHVMRKLAFCICIKQRRS